MFQVCQAMSKVWCADKFSELSVESMQSSHLHEIMCIERLAYPFPWRQSMFESSLASRDDCRVIVLDGELLGYSVVSYILDEAHLLNLCISPGYSGQGLGRFLLKTMIQRALEKKCMMFFLEVRVSNTSAINLYFSEGFNEVGIRPNYYPAENGREDAMLMTLDMSVDLYA